MVVSMIIISNAQPPRTILAAIITILLINVCEMLNLLYIYLVLGQGTVELLANPKAELDPTFKAIATMPSTIFFAISALIVYFITKKIARIKESKKKEIDGNISA
ncbi:MAG: hypothetical protein BGN88_10585 [Clostridiales bacterium 43-6]|nr:MAG: hypothetical protein BGN88_10585 [Clostridiales bacterium 43-6]